jgi:hypothetical protein
MSIVHVNRVLQSLRRRGVLHLLQHQAYVQDWDTLKALAEFDAGYLEHTPQRLAPQVASLLAYH